MPHGERVFDHFDRSLTSELAELEPRTLLYIGLRPDTNPWWHSTFAAGLRISAENITVLEIYEDNYEFAKQRYQNVVQGDARKVDQLFSPGQFDVVFWDHGPEHVSSEDLRECTPKLSSLAGKVLLYCCPWGEWPQGSEGGNSHEAHHTVDDKMLESLGMRLIRFGAPGQEKGGELIAYFTKP